MATSPETTLETERRRLVELMGFDAERLLEACSPSGWENADADIDVWTIRTGRRPQLDGVGKGRTETASVLGQRRYEDGVDVLVRTEKVMERAASDSWTQR